MSKIRGTPVRVIAALAFLIALTAASVAKTDPAFASIKIKNFGQMDDRFYRGGQPKPEDLKDLASIGIKTVINLRDDFEPWEQQAVEAAGMRYVSIPMDGHAYPSKETVNAFLKVVNDPETGKFFAHCAGGKHRTGSMGAVYRYTHDHWNYDQVYAEMKKFDFYTRFGHGDLKKFVQDYAVSFQTKQAAVATVAQ